VGIFEEYHTYGIQQTLALKSKFSLQEGDEIHFKWRDSIRRRQPLDSFYRIQFGRKLHFKCSSKTAKLKFQKSLKKNTVPSGFLPSVYLEISHRL
jgi:hypothetical protein